MRHLSISLIALGCALAAAPAYSQGGTQASAPASTEPKTLDAAFGALDRLLPDSTKRAIRDSTPDYLVRFHHGLGTWIRNTWGLWRGSALYDDLHARGLRHPDDMSSVILDAYRARLRNEVFNMDSVVADYAEYWRVHAEPSPLKFAGCPAGVEVRGGFGEDPPPGAAHRFVHLATCNADGKWWAFEAGRGWYRPDAAVVTRFTRPTAPTSPRP